MNLSTMELIGRNWGPLAFAGGAVVGVIYFYFKLRNSVEVEIPRMREDHDADIAMIESKHSAEIVRLEGQIMRQEREINGYKRKLYDENGESIYMPRKSCKECRKSCQDGICAKLDRVDLSVAEMNKTFGDYMQEVSRFIGRVEQFMERGKGSGS